VEGGGALRAEGVRRSIPQRGPAGNSLEYQVPIRADDNTFLMGFVDSGTVARKSNQIDYRAAVGFGLRVVVPALGPVPAALDFGFPLTRSRQDNEQMFNFWMGYFR